MQGSTVNNELSKKSIKFVENCFSHTLMSLIYSINEKKNDMANSYFIFQNRIFFLLSQWIKSEL